jgi:hypothetical protein
MADITIPQAHITVGGEKYGLAPLALKQLKIAWPAIARLSKITEPIHPDGTTKEALEQEMLSNPQMASDLVMARHAERIDAMLDVVVASAQRINSQVTKAKWEDVMTYEETLSIPAAFNTVCEISGLNKQQGEVQPSAMGNGSTATSTHSLPN